MVVPQLARLQPLTRSARTTVGVVTSLMPESHNSMAFQYDVGGRQFTGYAYGGNRKVGDRLTVYFSPEHPENSSLSEPQSAFRSALREGAFVSVLFAVAQIYVK